MLSVAALKNKIFCVFNRILCILSCSVLLKHLPFLCWLKISFYILILRLLYTIKSNYGSFVGIVWNVSASFGEIAVILSMLNLCLLILDFLSLLKQKQAVFCLGLGTYLAILTLLSPLILITAREDSILFLFFLLGEVTQRSSVTC